MGELDAESILSEDLDIGGYPHEGGGGEMCPFVEPIVLSEDVDLLHTAIGVHTNKPGDRLPQATGNGAPHKELSQSIQKRIRSGYDGGYRFGVTVANCLNVFRRHLGGILGKSLKLHSGDCSHDGIA